MADQITLEIVSPTRLLLSEPVDLAEIPAYDGYIGVLPGHAPMIATLRGGLIRVHQGGSVTKQLYVGRGFVEIAPDRCTVLADEVIPADELSLETAHKRVADAETAYQAAAETRDADEIEQAIMRLAAARAMEDAARR
ncbi:ATP synthase F1 subunit epsilon [Elioraea sp.]|uniref:ATP synthase F1 subunit epsilon n=1 Tax=Elioraea sp. TaxID=2185103 RepID=UPI003F708B94